MYLKVAKVRFFHDVSISQRNSGNVTLMESFDFTFFVLPLGILVFVLVAGILYKVKKEEIEQERKVKRICAYLKERVKQRGLVERELAHIDSLLKSKSIDKGTYERLRFVIRMNEMEDPEAIDALSMRTGK